MRYGGGIAVGSQRDVLWIADGCVVDRRGMCWGLRGFGCVEDCKWDTWTLSLLTFFIFVLWGLLDQGSDASKCTCGCGQDLRDLVDRVSLVELPSSDES